MSNLSGIDAILFDLNGVLVEASGWHEQAFKKAMKDYGYEVSDSVSSKGLTTIQRLEELKKLGKAPSDYSEIVRLKQKYILETIEEKCKPDSRVIEAVEFAHEYTKGNIAVVTNCSFQSAHRMLEVSGIAPLFNVVVTSADVKGKVKPHPISYIEAYIRLGVNAKKCLVIDDSSTGIMAGIDARCRTLRLRKFESLTADRLNKYLKRLEIRI